MSEQKKTESVAKSNGKLFVIILQSLLTDYFYHLLCIFFLIGGDGGREQAFFLHLNLSFVRVSLIIHSCYYFWVRLNIPMIKFWHLFSED